MEALHIADKASPVTSTIKGIIAAVLKQKGEMSRAEELLQKLMCGEEDQDRIGLAYYHFLRGETNRAAELWEKLIDHRHPLAPNLGYVLFHSTSQWPQLARLMNLAEQVG